MMIDIRPFELSDEAEVIQLWEACGLLVPWNDPHKDIQRKLAEQPGLFLVGTSEGRIAAAMMAGYEGHRGSVFYLGVAPSDQGKGIGRMMMEEAERHLREAGCPKINILVRHSNRDVMAFYEKLGYAAEDVVNMGKRLEKD